MIGYVTMGTNDLARAVKFYEELFKPLNVKRVWEGEGGVAWSTGEHAPGFGVIKPYDKRPATWGNGAMVAFVMDSKENVDLFYKKAIELGAMDEGPAGPRGDGFYAGYVRDLDGNKLNFFTMK
jgi:catechol 2,3-dioxygenase-like lactoylglutathione lyase family enzyme